MQPKEQTCGWDELMQLTKWRNEILMELSAILGFHQAHEWQSEYNI
jgi:hypothetical protein